MKVYYISAFERLRRLYKDLANRNELMSVDYIEVTQAEYNNIVREVMVPADLLDLKVFGFKLVING